MADTVLLCENPSQAQDGYDRIFYWASFESSPDAVSIPGILEKEAETFRKQYFDWLSALGDQVINGRTMKAHFEIRKDFSFWWMSLMVEKSQWKSPCLYQLFRLLVFEQLVREHDIKALTVSIRDDQAVRKTILNYCREAGIAVKIRPAAPEKKSFSLRLLFNVLPFTLQGLLSFINYLVLRWPSRSGRVQNLNSSSREGGVTFVSYLFNFDQEKAGQKEFYSRYWTKLHDVISGLEERVTWLHLFIKSDLVPDSGKAAQIISGFNKGPDRQIHFLLDICLGRSVVKNVLKDYCKIWRTTYRLRKVQSFFKVPGSRLNFWPVFEKEWKSSFLGVTAVSNCLFLNLFEVMFKAMPMQKKGFYLLENQPWERSLIYAWKNAGHGKLTGIQHTVVSSWDLRHFFSPVEYSEKRKLKLPLPDKVAVNGNAALKAYQSGGFPENRICQAEALRYLYLGSPGLQKDCPQKKSPVIRLLVLGDYSPGVTKRQMSILSDAFKHLPPNVEIHVKAHPASPINPADWPAVRMQVTTRPLDELLDSYDIAFASNATAAAVDSYLAGKTVFIALDPESFNMSPLRGYPGVEFIATPVQLIECLKKTKRPDGRINSNFFSTNDNLPGWGHLLAD